MNFNTSENISDDVDDDEFYAKANIETTEFRVSNSNIVIVEKKNLKEFKIYNNYNKIQQYILLKRQRDRVNIFLFDLFLKSSSRNLNDDNVFYNFTFTNSI